MENQNATTAHVVADPFPTFEFGAKIIDPGKLVENPVDDVGDRDLLKRTCQIRVKHGSLLIGHRHDRDPSGRYTAYHGALTVGPGAIVEIAYGEAMALLTRFHEVAYLMVKPPPSADALPGEEQHGVQLKGRLPLPNGMADSSIELTDVATNEPFKLDVARRIEAKRATATATHAQQVALAERHMIRRG